MSFLEATAWIFDPALPFQKIQCKSPGIDTWHDHVLINRDLSHKVPHVKHAGATQLRVSGGAFMTVDSIEVGLQIGSIQIPRVVALVVDGGTHDILLGSNIFTEIFRAKGRNESTPPGDGVRYSDERKDDPSALSIELYPVSTPFPAKQLEDTLRNQRIIYNTGLIASNEVQTDRLSEKEIDEIIENDAGIPSRLVLQISCVDSGSIWVSLKSGSQAALKRLGSLFETGASAKLAEQLAEAKKAEVAAAISAATRDAVAAQIISEQEKLAAENIRATYATWRKDFLEQISFIDELIARQPNKSVAKQLKQRRDEAILKMADQQMVPIVRNVPGSFFSLDNGIPRLPPPS